MSAVAALVIAIAASALVLLVGAFAIDLARRETSARSNLLILGMCSLLALPPLAALSFGPVPAERWSGLGRALAALSLGLSVESYAATGLLIGLSLSRALRPEGAFVWRSRALSWGLAICGLSMAILLFRHDVTLLCAPLVLGCAAAQLAFARDGGPRIERGADDAMGLVAVASLSLVAAAASLRVVDDIDALLHFRLPHEVHLPSVLVWSGLPAIATIAAIWRRPTGRGRRALLALLPGLLSATGMLLDVLTIRQPAGGAPLVEVRDLTGVYPRDLLGLFADPPCCVQRLEGGLVEPCPERCVIEERAPWQLEPELALSDVPGELWLVHRDTPRLLWKLGQSQLVVDPSRVVTTQHIRLEEVDGEARLAAASFPVPQGDPWWSGREALPLGEELHQKLDSAPLAAPDTLGVEIPRRSRWTVQEAVSLCASAARNDLLVGCLVSP